MVDWNDDALRLPFGKYEGRRLSDPSVSASYLRYLYGWNELFEDTREAVKRELIARGVPFGKHKGTPLDQLPTGYLSWLHANCDLFPPLDQFVQDEIDRREREQELQQRRRAERPAPARAKRPKTKRRDR